MNYYSFEEYVNSEIPVKKQLLNYFNVDKLLTIFDIGSCEGEDSIRYSKLFPKAIIHSFEPNPLNYNKAKKNIQNYNAMQNITLNNIALSNSIGTKKMYISSGHPKGTENNSKWNYGNKSSSLLKPNMSLMKKNYSWLTFNDVINVQTSTLLTYCDNNNIKEIDFVHLDVQGAEKKVLEGAGALMVKIKMIFLEVENVELYINQPLKNEIEGYLIKNHFRKIIDIGNGVTGDQLYFNEKIF